MNFTSYLKEIQKELKLTTFPGQNIVINFTLFVIIFTAAMAAYLGALDLGLGESIIQGINNYKTPVAQVELSTTTISTSTNATTSPNNIFTNPNK